MKYDCPACGVSHSVPIAPTKQPGKWKWDKEKKTLSPSVRRLFKIEGKQKTTCHYFIREGRIEFCSDSPKLAGKKIALEEREEDS